MDLGMWKNKQTSLFAVREWEGVFGCPMMPEELRGFNRNEGSQESWKSTGRPMSWILRLGKLSFYVCW